MSEDIKSPTTRYNGLSQNEIYSMYRQESWLNLTPAEKQDLLQETVNLEAAKYNNVYSAEVSLQEMPSNVSGYETHGKIVMNRDLVVSNVLKSQYGDETITYNVPDGSYRTLETVLHEHQHVLQESILNGKVQTDDATYNALDANDTTLSIVDGQVGSQYLEGETEYALYYMQPCEIDAYKTSQDKVAFIIDSLKEEYGSEPAMDAYLSRMEDEGYEARIAEYNLMFNCDDTPKEIEQVLINTYAHRNEPVNPQIEAAVKAEMIASANQCLNSNKEEAMSKFEPRAVTREEFEATLHDSVNRYYEHSINDPNSPKEDALAETSQMSEKHFDAIEAFNAEASAANLSSLDGVDSDGAGTDGGVGSEGGGIGDSGGVGDGGGVGM